MKNIAMELGLFHHLVYPAPAESSNFKVNIKFFPDKKSYVGLQSSRIVSASASSVSGSSADYPGTIMKKSPHFRFSFLCI